MQNGGSTWAFAWSVPGARRPGCLAEDRTQTLCGVVGFRSFGRFPVPWQQRVQFVPFGAPRYDAFEHIGEPGQWIDIVQLRRLDQCGDDCPMPPALSTDSDRAHGPFDGVGIELQAPSSGDSISPLQWFTAY